MSSKVSKNGRKKSLKAMNIENNSISDDSDTENNSRVPNAEFNESDGDEVPEETISDEEIEEHSLFLSMKQFDQHTYYKKHNENSILVSINQSQNLFFTGKCTIKVIKGAVEIYGYTLTRNNSSKDVFSPRGHSLLYIRSIASRTEDDDIDEEDEINDYSGSVVVLQSLDNEWAEGLRNIHPNAETLVGPRITGLGSNSSKLPKMKNFMEKLGFQLVPESMLVMNRVFSTSVAWDETFYEIKADLSSSPRICIFGGKGVGKSTFSRWMTNKFLGEGRNEVAYIDLDPGQTEFTPPGMISVSICKDPILGPNFTHLRQPERSIFLGGVNVSDSPVTYLKAVMQIFEFLSSHEEYTNIPWIINTMGFCQGLGVHLGVSTIKIFQPTSVIQLSINNERRSYPFDLNLQNVKKSKAHFLQKNLPHRYTDINKDYRYFKIESVCDREDTSNTNQWGASPKVLRDNVMLSYFADLIGHTDNLSFSSVMPYSLSLEKIAIGTMNTNLSYEGIIRSITGNLVALCRVPSDYINQMNVPDQMCSLSTTGQQNQAYFTNAESFENNCFGYGIVRAFDKDQNRIYVVTPVDQVILKTEVNSIIAAGDVGLPIQFYINGNENSSEPRYIIGNAQGGSKLHQPSKKYFVPKKRSTHSVLKNSLL